MLSARVINGKVSSETTKKFYFFPLELHESLIFHMRARDWEGVKGSLEEAFSYMDKDGIPQENAYTVMIGLISVCMSFAIESGYSIEDLFGTDFSPIQAVLKLTSLQEGKNWIEEIYKKGISAASETKSSKSQTLYHTAKTFIQENYSDPDLSVESISARLFFDSSYLRKIFKREGGASVSEYMTYVRMQKAKDLIGTNSVKLLGIAQQVGFHDPNYFSKCFKKQFGITPTEYQNRLSKRTGG
jgi:two-component system, response regulator YesN